MTQTIDGEIVVITGASGEADAARHGWRVLAILSTLMGFASVSTDLYLPALPTMARALRSDAGAMELTISGYLIGFSLGQLVWGPLGDRYVRRSPLAWCCSSSARRAVRCRTACGR